MNLMEVGSGGEHHIAQKGVCEAAYDDDTYPIAQLEMMRLSALDMAEQIETTEKFEIPELERRVNEKERHFKKLRKE